MEHIQGVIKQLESFIFSQKFFYYHGIVLAFLWFIASTIGILLRKLSRQLHALCFFFIDFITAFFIICAIVRVYPNFKKFDSWSLVKKVHVIGGVLFLILLIYQHVSGVNTWLKGIVYNPSHRKWGVIVSSLGKFLAVGGMLLAGWQQQFILVGLMLALGMTAFGCYVHFVAGGQTKEHKRLPNETRAQVGRQRSPPREVKRD